MTREQSAEQFRRAVQMFAKSLTDEEAMEIACVYPSYHSDNNVYAPDVYGWEVYTGGQA